MIKHVLRRLIRRLQDRLYRDKTYNYLPSDSTPAAPICPHCFTPLERLAEHAIYIFRFRRGRFHIDPDFLSTFLCPACNGIVDSPALRALINYDYSAERGSVGR
jgi:hypothetical protein